MLLLTCGRCRESITDEISRVSYWGNYVSLSVKSFPPLLQLSWLRGSPVFSWFKKFTWPSCPKSAAVKERALSRHIITRSLCVNQPSMVVARGEPCNRPCDWAVREMAEPQMDHVAWGQHDVHRPFQLVLFRAHNENLFFFFLSGAPYWFSNRVSKRSILQPISDLRWGWHGSSWSLRELREVKGREDFLCRCDLTLRSQKRRKHMVNNRHWQDMKIHHSFSGRRLAEIKYIRMCSLRRQLSVVNQSI